MSVMRHKEARGYQHIDGFAEDLLRWVSKNPLRALVEEGDSLVGIDRDDGVVGNADDSRKSVVSLAFVGFYGPEVALEGSLSKLGIIKT
jgi:hypothetical protein